MKQVGKRIRNKNWITALCCGAVILSPISPGIKTQAAWKLKNVQEYIIQADDNKTIEKIAQSYEDEIINETQETTLLEDQNALVMDLTAEQAKNLDKKSGVTVERNITLSGESVEKADPEDVKRLAKSQWNKAAIKAENVKKAIGDKKINVAILDSGVDILSDVRFINQTSLISEENTDDRTGHGTMISNLIACNRNGFCETGIIPGNISVSLYNVRILDEENQTPLSRVIEGIQWCIDNQMDVVNMSFGTETNSEILHDAIKKAEAAGIVMVASVGNSGERGDGITEYPAGYQEVIGVGSVNEKMERSVFSNTGTSVELVAPGENIPVTSYWGLQGSGSGTSYAAAHVTAIAALLWSENPGRTAREIRTLMNRSAISLGERKEYGHGLVNYEYASKHRELANIVKNAEFSEEEKGFRDKEEDFSNKEESPEDSNQDYDIPISLKASWNSAGHTKLINSLAVGMSEGNVNAIKDAAIYVDKSGTLKEYDVLHARKNTNYVAAAKCLYHAALDWKGGDNYDEIYHEADLYRSSKESETVRQKNIKELKTAMRKAVNYNFHDTSQTGITSNRGRLQLLGLSIHVAGDAYAHKTMCDVSDMGKEINNIYNGIINEEGKVQYDKDKRNQQFDAINGALKNGKDSIEDMIETAQSEAGLTTSAMGGATYFKQDEKSINICNKFYTDSPNYMTKRYTVGTKVATSYLLKYYSSEKYFSPLIFCPYEIKETSDYRNNYSYKLLNFKAQFSSAGYSPLSFMGGKNGYSASAIYALSFDK